MYLIRMRYRHLTSTERSLEFLLITSLTEKTAICQQRLYATDNICRMEVDVGELHYLTFILGEFHT